MSICSICCVWRESSHITFVALVVGDESGQQSIQKKFLQIPSDSRKASLLSVLTFYDPHKVHVAQVFVQLKVQQKNVVFIEFTCKILVSVYT